LPNHLKQLSYRLIDVCFDVGINIFHLSAGFESPVYDQ
jgi:hypothetical protein